MKLYYLFFFSLFLLPHLLAGGLERDPKYPAHWWAAVDRASAPNWEILPQDALLGEVILSKRNELGLFSNFGTTSFTYRGKRYASIEGLWQMMKYPEGKKDPRSNYPGIDWKYTREAVAQMTGMEAKQAGKLANKNMKKMGIDWITFEGKQIFYRTKDKEEHFRIINGVSWAKIKQNKHLKTLLLSTGDLILKADHHQGKNPPPAYKYPEIYMNIRMQLQALNDRR